MPSGSVEHKPPPILTANRCDIVTYTSTMPDVTYASLWPGQAAMARFHQWLTLRLYTWSAKPNRLTVVMIRQIALKIKHLAPYLMHAASSLKCKISRAVYLTPLDPGLSWTLPA